MFIQTESTPNPLTLKFIPGVSIMPSGTLFLTSSEEAAKRSPLAKALFDATSEITAVFLGSDFITVTKGENANWGTLKTIILTTVMDHFMAGKQVLIEQGNEEEEHGEESELVKQIKELIETRVRPAVAQDGGDIVFRGFEDGVVKLELHGSCSGCPSSTITLKNGIENMLKHYVPEVIAVEAVA